MKNLLTYFKQLFCKHEFVTYTIWEECGFNLGGIMVEMEERKYQICRKCGKILGMCKKITTQETWKV